VHFVESSAQAVPAALQTLQTETAAGVQTCEPATQTSFWQVLPPVHLEESSAQAVPAALQTLQTDTAPGTQT
jgi:hypothetical protein